LDMGVTSSGLDDDVSIFAMDAEPIPEEQIDQIVDAVRDVVGPDVVAAYLHGSAVLDRLRPRSDLDILVVARRRTSREQKRLLADRLLALSGSESPGMPRPVEMTIVVESEFRPWRYPPSFDFHYGEWLRSEFEGGNLEPWSSTTDPDLAVLIAIVLLGNVSLFGPPPTEIFDPVPPGDYISAMVGDIETLRGQLDSYTRNTLLTLARIWMTVETGEIRSKDAAAAWALARLPDEHCAVLTRARSVYLGEADERWDDLAPCIRSHADYVAAEIERLVADTGR
jgi:predicted nucleotidyltransferase